MILRSIAVDCGKYNTKVCVSKGNGTIEYDKFRTLLTPSEEDIGEDCNSYFVRFEGRSYIVGERANIDDWDVSTSKSTDTHRIATYVAIANHVGNGDQVNLAIGCPLNTYVNKEERLKYVDFIAPRNKQISITVNGKPTTFIIRKVFVYPESAGVIYLNPGAYRKKLVNVIDIGGLNANCCMYDKLSPRADVHTMFSSEKGSNMLFADIKSKLERELSTKVSNYLMETVLEEGSIHKDREASARIISDMKLRHIEEIKKDCARRGWDFENTLTVFTGGASIYLKDEIEKVFEYVDTSHLSEMGDFANAEGFLAQMLTKVF